MNRTVKGALVATVTSTFLTVMPAECMTTAQAPTQTVLIESAESDDGNTTTGQIELIPNPILRENQKQDTAIAAFAISDSQESKINSLIQSRCDRQKQEAAARERARKKRLARQREKREAARRKAIQACCGVAAGTKDQKILERIVEAEAGGEDYTGKLLVANVILNRVKSKSFPKSIEAVVFAHSGSRYQFSPIADGRYYRVHVSKQTKKAVAAALQGKDPSQGALYFMQRSSAASSNVSWFDSALTRLFRHGCHEFYK